MQSGIVNERNKDHRAGGMEPGGASGDLSQLEAIVFTAT
jgi:hypothetical protein